MVASNCLIHHETGGTIVFFTEISILIVHKMQNLFLKFPAPHTGLPPISRILSRVVVR